MPLAEAEVSTRLKNDFDLIEKPYVESGVSYKGEGIFVLDDAFTPPKLAGFVTYKPRSPALTSASIGYMVVEKGYRGQGILKMMMKELLSQYPIVGLDCPPHLVTLYEKFGFAVAHTQECHIAMATGPLNGKMVSLDTAEMMTYPELRQAKQRISAILGKKSQAGYVKFNQQSALAVRQAEEFVSNRMRRERK